MSHSNSNEPAGEARQFAPEAVDSPSGGHSALLRVHELENLVEKLVASWQDSRVLQNRRWHRVSYQKPIAVTPLDESTELVVGRTRIVRGHDLSPAGVSFTHRTLLPYRKMAATFALGKESSLSVIVLLTWCRFTNRGYYKSGGRFLRTLRLPKGTEPDWSQLPCT